MDLQRQSTRQKLDALARAERHSGYFLTALIGVPLVAAFGYFTIDQPVHRNEVPVIVEHVAPQYSDDRPPYLQLRVRLPDGQSVAASSYNREYPKLGSTITVEARRYWYGRQSYYWN